jgi:predicted MFS family arabinose efflux permease
MLTTTFAEGPQRVRALGVWSAVNAAGGALGVPAGGLLTEYAGRRRVMLINLPIVVAVLALVPAGVPAGTAPARRERLDALGAVLATGGVGLLVLGVVRTDTLGRDSPVTWATLAVAAVLLAAFVFAESRADAPLLRLGLLRSRWVAGANVLVFLAAAGQFTAFSFVSLYMQQVLGMGAAANNVEIAYTPTDSSWLNRIGARFTALRSFALDGTDHASHKEQGSTIRRFIIRRNKHAAGERLRKVVIRANVAC